MKRPEHIPYGLITEESIDWRTSKLLNAIAELGPDADGIAMFPLIKRELWEVVFESSHQERGGELGMEDPEIEKLLP